MKRKIPALILAVAMLLAALPFTASALQSSEIYAGLSYGEEQIINAAGKNVNMFVLEVSGGGALEIIAGVPGDKVPLQPGMVQTTSMQAKAAAASGRFVLAAVNADFFEMGFPDRIQPMGITVKNGQELTPPRGWTFFGILKDGTPVVGDAAVFNEVRAQLKEAVGANSHYLIKNGDASVRPGTQHAPYEVHPRTAVGIKADGSVVFMVADGRSAASDGLRLDELADYMKGLGVVDAANLDGGGSSAMVLQNNRSNFVVKNKPSDGKERPVGNTLLVIDPSAAFTRGSDIFYSRDRAGWLDRGLENPNSFVRSMYIVLYYLLRPGAQATHWMDTGMQSGNQTAGILYYLFWPVMSLAKWLFVN